MSGIAALTAQLVSILVRFKQSRGAECCVCAAKVVTEVGTSSLASEKPGACALLHVPGTHPAQGAV